MFHDLSSGFHTTHPVCVFSCPKLLDPKIQLYKMAEKLVQWRADYLDVKKVEKLDDLASWWAGSMVVWLVDLWAELMAGLKV